MKRYLIPLLALFICTHLEARNESSQFSAGDSATTDSVIHDIIEISETDVAAFPAFDSVILPPAVPLDVTLEGKRTHSWTSPYALPYSIHKTGGADWHRMWINTAVLSGAYITTLFVLELLPEDATSWNRATIQKTPMFERWYKNIFVHNPEIDHDKFIFNYILHPYAGAAYFMSARSCGFSFWGSFLYSFCVSTIGWEFGIEAFMERPSYQDIIITPLVGSILGECMYRGKRAIVERGYDVAGSTFLGHTLCFFLDPVNEVIDLFRGNPCHAIGAQYGARRHGVESSLAFTPRSIGLSVRF